MVCDTRFNPVKSFADPRSTTGIPYAGFMVEISNDGIEYSKQSHLYRIYDSRCINCNPNSTCQQKVLYHNSRSDSLLEHLFLEGAKITLQYWVGKNMWRFQSQQPSSQSLDSCKLTILVCGLLQIIRDRLTICDILLSMEVFVKI